MWCVLVEWGLFNANVWKQLLNQNGVWQKSPSVYSNINNIYINLEHKTVDDISWDDITIKEQGGVKVYLNLRDMKSKLSTIY